MLDCQGTCRELGPHTCLVALDDLDKVRNIQQLGQSARPPPTQLFVHIEAKMPQRRQSALLWQSSGL